MAKLPRSTANDFDPAVMRLFDQYVHGDIDRRSFLLGAARFAVGSAGAAGILAALTPQFAAAQQIAPDDVLWKGNKVLSQVIKTYHREQSLILGNKA